MAKDASIQLFVGLGNPGEVYDKTRHNAGAWFVDRIAEKLQTNWRQEKKLKGHLASWKNEGTTRYLFRPASYMNVSGQAIRAIQQFYKIPTQSILIAHDDLDLSPGTVKLKFDGGHGGHNGLRDTITQLNSAAFYRLRIGIGHPGHQSIVHDYVLSRPSVADKQAISTAIEAATTIIPCLLSGEIDKAIQQLHTTPSILSQGERDGL